MSTKPEHNSSQDTETLILQAAEEEFLSKGFSGARTTTIASKAGVTHAMFHYYFRTKEKLFERIISEKIALLKKAMLDSIVDLDAPLPDILKNIIDKHLDFIAANPDLPRFLVGELYSNQERAHIFLNSLREYGPPMLSLLQKKIDAEAAEGNCRRVKAESLMLDVVALNVFPYMAAPAVNAALGNCMDDPAEFLKQRKSDNFQTILRKLKP